MPSLSEIRDKIKQMTPIKETTETIIDVNDYVGRLYQDDDGRLYTNHNLTNGIKIFTTFVSDSNPADDNYDGPFGDFTADTNWLSCVENMGLWYGNNIQTYQRQTVGSYHCPLLGGKMVRDDCSGFVCACLWLHGVEVELTSTCNMQPNMPFGQILQKNGFKCIPFSCDILSKGDIYVTGTSGHTEINWGPRKQMGWGSVHYHKMPTGWSAYNPNSSHANYKWIYRK